LGAKGVELMESDGIESLPERTRAVVMSSVSYTTGRRPDLVRIVKLAHEMDALVYIDGTQSVGALQFDVREVQPDFFAVNSYKWLLGPNGASFFYVSPELRRTLEPSVIGWRSDSNWRSVDSLSKGAPRFSDRAERYEGGMLNFPSLYAMAESIRMNLEIGPDVIERRVLELAGATAEMLRRLGATIQHENTNIVAAHWPGRDVSGLSKQLCEQRIVVAARHGNLRVSPHFYNDEPDVERLEAAVRAIVRGV
jgi:selenocysteine lyase/cysteine desulfurase